MSDSGRGPQYPLVSRHDLSTVRRITIVLPGALTSIDAFRGFDVLEQHGYAVLYYRLPGLDGRPLDGYFDLEQTARSIAEFIEKDPERPTRIVGHSLGAATALRIGAISSHQDLRIAAISTPAPFPSNISAALRSTFDLFGLALDAGTLSRDRLWHDYYRILLFGRDWDRDRKTAKRAEAILRTEKENIIIPDNQLASAHSRSLSLWKIEDAEALKRHRIRLYHGTEDPVFHFASSRRTARRIGAELHAIQGHGHIPLVSYPELFGDIVEFFLEDLQ